MKERKAIAAYAAGTLVLSGCIAAAWFLPEAYGNWQDKRQIGQVNLSGRENIEFLDGNSLDQIRRWRILASQKDIFECSWNNDAAADYALGLDFDRFVQDCIEEIGRWCDSGLLPYDRTDLDIYVEYTGTKVFYVETETIPVGIFRFCSEKPEDDIHISVVMDLETEKLYYVSAFGKEMREYMAEQMGYETYDIMQKSLMNGEAPLAVRPDISGMDFAAVCGADECSVTCFSASLDLEAELRFDTFRTSASRLVVCSAQSDWGYGMAVMFGPTAYVGMFMEVVAADYYGSPGAGIDEQAYGEVPVITEQWLEFVSSGLSDVRDFSPNSAYTQ